MFRCFLITENNEYALFSLQYPTDPISYKGRLFNLEWQKGGNLLFREGTSKAENYDDGIGAA